MANPQRRDPVFLPPATEPPALPESGYRPGGGVGRMQADLARRLAGDRAPAAAPPFERTVRVLSVAGGVVALVAGYAGAAALVLR